MPKNSPTAAEKPTARATEFNVTVVSDAFAGKSRLERQRLVYGVLAEEMAGRVHALALITLTPEEAAAG